MAKKTIEAEILLAGKKMTAKFPTPETYHNFCECCFKNMHDMVGVASENGETMVRPSAVSLIRRIA